MKNKFVKVVMLSRNLKVGNVPTETTRSGKRFQGSTAREKKENFETFNLFCGLDKINE